MHTDNIFMSIVVKHSSTTDDNLICLWFRGGIAILGSFTLPSPLEGSSLNCFFPEAKWPILGVNKTQDFASQGHLDFAATILHTRLGFYSPWRRLWVLGLVWCNWQGVSQRGDDIFEFFRIRRLIKTTIWGGLFWSLSIPVKGERRRERE